jgi:hypothetical protein
MFSMSFIRGGRASLVGYRSGHRERASLADFDRGTEATEGTKDTKKNTKQTEKLLLTPCSLRVLRAFVVNQWTISTNPRSLCVLRGLNASVENQAP